ncbi:hypothetical protein Lal_00037579 [Lupinus albus]|nr:hypothetical protein Lal_00037579 [Lupinus albus]
MGQEGVRGKETDMPKWQRQGWRQNEMQQPQKCPRCESLNTKFCYYNNNSLTQPRYFCKTCRRHWTLGGTLRSVPFGGTCRKRKSARNSSYSGQFRQPPPPPSHEGFVQTQHANLTTMVNAKTRSSMAGSSTNPLYLGGDGYFSSLAKIHSMNHLQSKAFDQSLKLRSDVIGSSSILGHASTFNGGYPAPQYQIRPSQFYQMGSREREALSLYMAKQSLTIPSNMANRNNNPTSHNDWTHSFINDANNRSSDTFPWSNINDANNRSSDAFPWSNINNTYFGGNTERNTDAVGSSPLIQNQWPAFPGYGPVP